MNETTKRACYPLKFKPVLKDYIWGGRNLEKHLGRDLPPDREIAESWEIAAHEHGDVQVANGLYAGLTLSEVQHRLGADLVGQRAAWAQQRDKFPLLIKLLDANRRLSVQVHPDDGYAQDREGDELGKTEMWVVLHAEKDAAIILGVEEGTTRERFTEAIAEGSLESHLHEIKLQTGDFVCVPSGTLHAILGGLLIVEIQQNSNVTYRIYDWNRVGSDGKPRPLHIDKALDVINFDQVAPRLPEPEPIADTGGVGRWELCGNDYFVVERVELEHSASYSGECNGATMEIWGTIAGDVQITTGDERIELPAVQFSLLPACLGPFSINSTAGATLLRTYLPG